MKEAIGVLIACLIFFIVVLGLIFPVEIVTVTGTIESTVIEEEGFAKIKVEPFMVTSEILGRNPSGIELFTVTVPFDNPESIIPGNKISFRCAKPKHTVYVFPKSCYPISP